MNDDPTPTNRWQQIDALFGEALDLAPSERLRLLDERCTGDPDLRARVQALLEAAGQAGDFLERPAETYLGEETAQALRSGSLDLSIEPEPTRAGQRVGPYRVLHAVGAGGMATVYLANRADGQFDQRVALKFLRRGFDPELVRRFLAERQILSSLNHPNIAGLIDGGTTADGQPWLAMEYVDGKPITDYCDANQCSIELRLRLFLEVAKAIQYAHTNLIVHRDIKPSNVLVTGDGQVKLLDFGIAKLLDPEAFPADTPVTRTGWRPLTPEYASPEQVRGDPITTASDVYQLGMVLYRLLTGARPYSVKGLSGSSLEEAVSRTQPTPPSDVARKGATDKAQARGISPDRLARELRGDLDTILLQALRKEPERRYTSAQAMADDIERHLTGHPIAARRDSRGYRLGKFLQRNRWVAPTALAAFVLIGAYIGTLIRHGNQLEQERNVAQAEAAKAQEVTRFIVQLFSSPDDADRGLGEGRRDITVRQALLEGVERYRSELADQPAIKAQLFASIADVLHDLDATNEALALRTEVLELERALYGDTSAAYHESSWQVAELTGLTNRDSALALFEQHLELSRRLYGDTSVATGRALQSIGVLEVGRGRLVEGSAKLEEAIEVLHAANSAPALLLVMAYGELSDAYNLLELPEEGLAVARSGHDMAIDVYGPDHSLTARMVKQVAEGLQVTGQLEESRRWYRQALVIQDRELGPDHSRTIGTRSDYAILLIGMGAYAEAERVHRIILAARIEHWGEQSEDVAGSLQNLAVAIKYQERFDEADSLLQMASAMYRSVMPRGHFYVAFPLLTLSEIRLGREDYRGAEEAASEATGILMGSLGGGSYVTAVAQCRWGRALDGLGRPTDARKLLGPAVDILTASNIFGAATYLDECRTALASLGD